MDKKLTAEKKQVLPAGMTQSTLNLQNPNGRFLLPLALKINSQIAM